MHIDGFHLFAVGSHMKFSKTWAAAAAMLALAGTAQASQMTPVDAGLGVLDSGANLEWTANMNLNGPMTWAGANAWIATLNANKYAGHNDWRLPTLNPSDTSCSRIGNPIGYPQQYFGYGCTGGELSRLFVTQLGNKAGESVLNPTGDTVEQIANLALFSNVQSGTYWSGTEYTPDATKAWAFYAQIGYQDFDFKSSALYSVAVRPGSVPEPQTYAMLMVGLVAMLRATKRRPA